MKKKIELSNRTFITIYKEQCSIPYTLVDKTKYSNSDIINNTNIDNNHNNNHNRHDDNDNNNNNNNDKNIANVMMMMMIIII